MDSIPPSVRRELDAALDELPIFPLPQTVLFPGALLPLHIFEPRYRTMVRDCLETHKAMAIALLRDPGDRDRDRAGSALPAIEPIAGLGVIIDHVELPDGRYNILLQGRARVRLEELPFIPPYRRARAAYVACSPGETRPEDLTALLASATAFASEIRARDPDFEFRFPAHVSPALAADLAAHHLVLDARERQSLLETVDVGLRVRRTTEALAMQHAALSGPSGGVVN